MTYLQALEEGSRRLSAAGIEEARQDAGLLLSYITRMGRAELFFRETESVSEAERACFFELIGKRAQRIPLQYITGEQEFCGLRFAVREGVLIPRPETELLAEAVFTSCAGKKVLDLCTGSGCIAVTVAKLGSPALTAAADISEEALGIAKENARFHQARVRFFCGDLLECVEGRYDVIVSNPPYVRRNVIVALMPEVREHEPELALDGGEDGLLFYRRIIFAAPDFLEPDGRLMFEIGHDQGGDVRELMERRGFAEVEVKKDYAGLDRMVFGVWKETRGEF